MMCENCGEESKGGVMGPATKFHWWCRPCYRNTGAILPEDRVPVWEGDAIRERWNQIKKEKSKERKKLQAQPPPAKVSVAKKPRKLKIGKRQARARLASLSLPR